MTNGPGAADSLYANRLVETQALRFEDVAAPGGGPPPTVLPQGSG